MDGDYAAFKSSSDGHTSEVGKWFSQCRCAHVRNCGNVGATDWTQKKELFCILSLSV